MATKYLTVRETAQRFGISKQGVYRLIHGREIAALIVGQSFRISEAEIERYERAHLQPAVPLTPAQKRRATRDALVTSGRSRKAAS